MFLAGLKFKNPLASKLASDFRSFDPGIIIIIRQAVFIRGQSDTRESWSITLQLSIDGGFPKIWQRLNDGFRLLKKSD